MPPGFPLLSPALEQLIINLAFITISQKKNQTVNNNSKGQKSYLLPPQNIF